MSSAAAVPPELAHLAGDDKGPGIIATICAVTVLETLFCAARIYTRGWIVGQLQLDDYLLILSVVSPPKPTGTLQHLPLADKSRSWVGAPSPFRFLPSGPATASTSPSSQPSKSPAPSCGLWSASVPASCRLAYRNSPSSLCSRGSSAQAENTRSSFGLWL